MTPDTQSTLLGALIALSVKTTLLLGAAWCVSRLARGWSAAARHVVWGTAVGAALALPVLTAIVPPAGMPSLASFSIAASPGAGAAHDGAPARGRSDAALQMDSLAATSGPRSAMSPVAAASWDAIARAALVLWAAGALAVGAWWGAGLVALLREARRGEPVRDPRIRAIYDRIARRLGVSPATPLLVTPRCAAPMTWGIVRPLVVLPAAAATWSDGAIADVLRHELAHVARRDCLVQALAQALCVVHWFNPMAWLAARELAAECEVACDDAAVAAGATPSAYAGSLVAIAAAAGATRKQRARPALGTFGRAASELERRVRGVLHGRRPDRTPGRGARMAAAAAALALVVPLAAVRRAEAPAPPQAPERLTSRQAADTGTGELVPLDPAVEAAVLAAARLPASGPDSAAIETLRAALGHLKTSPVDLVRERAVWTLSIARDGRVIEPAIAQLAHPDWRVRAYATWALGEVGDERAVAPLIASLGDPHWRPRMHAAYGLGELRAGARAVDPLIAALADSVYQVRVSAVTALGRIGDVRALPAVRARTMDSYAWVRMAAEEAEARLRGGRGR